MSKKYIFIFVFMFLYLLLINNYSFAEEILNIKEVNLQIGDYVTYSAGTWTEAEINKLKEENFINYDVPEGTFGAFQFVGVYAGNSRDVNTNARGTFSTGWRILSTNQGEIKIISTGCVEGFGMPFGDDNAYAGKYVLSGEKDASDYTDATKNMKARDWSMYENLDYIVPGKTHVILAEEIYWLTNNFEATDNNLRNIGEMYITGTVHCPEDMLIVLEDGSVDRYGGKVYGIRLALSLKDTIKVKNIGKSSDGYNIWQLIQGEEVEERENIELEQPNEVLEIKNKNNTNNSIKNDEKNENIFDYILYKDLNNVQFNNNSNSNQNKILTMNINIIAIILIILIVIIVIVILRYIRV